MDYNQASLEAHRRHRGKLEINSKMPVNNQEDLSIAYTPGVAEPSRAIHANPELARELVATKNMVAVVTNGTAVLGLGDIGPEASLPVMEGKAVLFKKFAGIDAFPIAIGTRDPDEFISTVINIAPTFGGINLEDIAAPDCFVIEEQLQAKLNIPVFHDDQHGTAIVVLAGLINSLKVTTKNKMDIKIVISGAGSAGIAVSKLLSAYGVTDILVCDSQGIISNKRKDLNSYKQTLLEFTNRDNVSGDLSLALKNADVFIGVSAGDLINAADVKTMKKDSIIFAMANPTPEIMPDQAAAAGAKIIATGRSDFPNQLNNVLVFPGIFKGLFAARATSVTNEMKIAAARALAALISQPSANQIIPSVFDKGVVSAIAKAIQATAAK